MLHPLGKERQPQLLPASASSIRRPRTRYFHSPHEQPMTFAYTQMPSQPHQPSRMRSLLTHHKLHRRAQLELLSFRADEGVDADPPVLCHNEAPDAGEAAAQKRLNRHRVVGPGRHGTQKVVVQ
eukprot:1159306-Pelagomonas_calceolata.AAC.9